MTNANDQAPTDGDRVTVAGLAREFEMLYRDMRQLRGLSRRIDELAASVAQLAETVAATAGQQPVGEESVSWLDFPADPGRPAGTSKVARDAVQLLGRLGPWVGAVYLRYSDAVSGFPHCWMWHPDIVEELLWLHQAWLSAYHDGAPVTAIGDWHDRQRPGVVARIRAYAGMCSLEAHQPGQDRSMPAPITPAADVAEAIAAWWATHRDQPGPAPTEDQLAAAAVHYRRAGSSRR
jgi:hypothetical protein